MINNNVAFKGYTYAQGSSPRKEIECDYVGYTDSHKADIKKAIRNNADLVKQNGPSKLDICILPKSASINFVPDTLDTDDWASTKTVKRFDKGMFESLDKFVKRVLNYAINNQAQLERDTEKDDKNFYKSLVD